MINKEEITLDFLKNNSNNSIFYMGVYFLLKDNIIIYIGQSNNVYNRIGYHIARGIIFDSYFIFPCEQNKLLETETFFLKKFNTEKNINKYSISDKKLTDIKGTITASKFRKLRKRILMFSGKTFKSDIYFTSLYGQIDFKQNIQLFLFKEKIKITKKELLDLTHGLI